MNLSTRVYDDVPKVIPLTGIVAGSDGTPYADADATVDYVGSLSSTMIMRGSADSSSKYISFRVGVRGARAVIARPVDTYRVDTSIMVSMEIQRSVEEMGRRNSAMPVTWDRMDLFGVVRRLAMGAAYYSVWGGITAAELRGGGNLNISAVAAAINPIAADNGAVFVSTKLVAHGRPNVLAALANAISGEGGTMYTDLLGVNSAGVVQVPAATDAALAQGCHSALRVLGSMYRASGKGAFYGLAVAQGVHRIKSVYGHSDEGAYIRDVFRSREAGVPYGAIVVDMEMDNAIPDPQRSVAGFRAVYDAIAIATAGAVALCDPMINYRGKDYPTIIVSDQSDVMDPGEENVGDAADSADLTTRWAEVSGDWSRYYARALAKIFVTVGGEAEVERHISAQANALAGTDNRHMRMKAAVAFCWIEPTCACPVGDVSFPAFVAMHGPLVVCGQTRTVPALDGCALLEGMSDHMRSSIQVDFRFARRHGLFVHLQTHVRNGTSNIKLESGVVNDFMLIGGAGALGGRILGRNGLDTYLWGRGQSSVIAPGEFVCLSKSLVFTVEGTSLNNRVFRNTHVPTAEECVGGDVVYQASRLVGGAPAAPGTVPVRTVMRARSRAAVSLSMAGDSGRSGTVIASQLMAPSLTDYGDLPASAYSSRPANDEDAVPPDPGAVDAAGAVEEDSEVNGSTGALPSGGVANGLQARVNIENRRDRGPKPPRTGRIGQGGGQGPQVRFAQDGARNAGPIPPAGAGVGDGPPPPPDAPPPPPGVAAQGDLAQARQAPLPE